MMDGRTDSITTDRARCGVATKNARFPYLQVLTNSEVINNIIEATPGLSADHLAIALLRDHILLQQVRLS